MTALDYMRSVVIGAAFGLVAAYAGDALWALGARLRRWRHGR